MFEKQTVPFILLRNVENIYILFKLNEHLYLNALYHVESTQMEQKYFFQQKQKILLRKNLG